MASYIPLSPVPLQFQDVNGDNLASGTLEFFESGTSTPTNLFSDNTGTSIGTSITLNSSGYPESGGNVITLFRDSSVDIKIVAKNSSAVTQWTSDGLNTFESVLAKTTSGEGASLIGVEDSAGNFSGSTVEAVLAAIGKVASGTFTPTWTGFSSAPTGDLSYYRIGNLCIVYNNTGSNMTGTSDATSMTITNIPADARPTTSVRVSAVLSPSIQDNGSTDFGLVTVNDSGTMIFGYGTHNSTGGFTASGTKGVLANWTLIYRAG